MGKLQHASIVAPPVPPPPSPAVSERPRVREARLPARLDEDNCGCWSFVARLLIWATRNNI
jgi:hypothetical protein